MSAPSHIPVLLAEVIAALRPAPGMVIVDATFGAGGYTRALLDAGARVHAFDRDPDAIAIAQDWPETRVADDGAPPRLMLYPQCFSAMVAALGAAGVTQVDGIAMDVGVSSGQLDRPERGFAFAAAGPLDMRMSQAGMSAADFLNTAPEAAIADVLYRYGEEPRSRRIARAIVAARPLATTVELASVVRRALGPRSGARAGAGKAGATKDPATRSFQAIRIHVNAELDELAAALVAAETLLAPGGRLAVVSFHSLEDRLVKHFLRAASGASAVSRHQLMPITASSSEQGPDSATFTAIARPIHPSPREVAANPRARSATLRHATRTAAPARALTPAKPTPARSVSTRRSA